MGRLEKTVINEIKCLAMDMANNINHIDYHNIMTGGDIFYALYGEELSYKRNAPSWINRDRVILASKNSELLYSTLFMSGFNVEINDLKNYGELNSRLSLYPNYNADCGVDVTGSDCHNFGVGVGIALAERFYETIINRIKPKSKLINFNTFILCKLTDLMSGLAYEALSYAGVQKLNKLIVLCEANEKTDAESIKIVMNEDLESKYESLGFLVLYAKNTIDSICESIDSAKKSKKPTIIFINTAVNSKAKSIESCNDIKLDMNHSIEPFTFDENTKELYLKIIDDRLNKPYQKWLIEYENCRNMNNSRLNEILDLLEKDEFDIEFDESIFKINEDYFEELAISNEKIINVIASKNPMFLGVALQGALENNTKIVKSSFNTPDDLLGQNVNLGMRNSILGDVANGLALLNLKVFCGVDASKVLDIASNIKRSAIMNLPVTYIINNDSVLAYNNGIYSPVEEINDLYSMPNMLVIRPADINEIIGSWEFVLKNSWPTTISINTSKVQRYRNTNAKYVKYGAYMIRKEKMRLDGVIIASGSDVAIAMDVAEEIFKDGIDLRVVSMPSMELFLKQNPRYEEQLLPKMVKTFVITSSSSLIWNRFASNPHCVFSIDNFVSSGKVMEVAKDLGLDKETIKRKIKENI